MMIMIWWWAHPVMQVMKILVVFEMMVQGQVREWTVVMIHWNPFDWPQVAVWWYIKQWNSIVYVIQGSGCSCTSSTITIITSTIVGVVVKMREIMIRVIILFVWCCWFLWTCFIPYSQRELCTMGLRLRECCSWISDEISGWILGLIIIDATCYDGAASVVVGKQGRGDAWWAYVKRKIRSWSSRLSENPLQAHHIYNISILFMGLAWWLQKYMYLWEITSFPLLKIRFWYITRKDKAN